MLQRLAISLLSFALLAPGVAGARTFAQPPAAAAAAARSDGAAPAPAPIDRAALIAALGRRRDHNLAAFHAYRTGGVYPHNTVRTGPLNVWRDADGHLCAAATMIDKDGQHDLVAKTAATSNQIRLLDVTDGPLLDWILTSGFTLEELDRIQAPMVMPPRRAPEPQARIAVDAALARGYATTEAVLIRHRKDGLAVAADRLMEHPALARALLGAVS